MARVPNKISTGRTLNTGSSAYSGERCRHPLQAFLTTAKSYDFTNDITRQEVFARSRSNIALGGLFSRQNPRQRPTCAACPRQVSLLRLSRLYDPSPVDMASDFPLVEPSQLRVETHVIMGGRVHTTSRLSGDCAAEEYLGEGTNHERQCRAQSPARSKTSLKSIRAIGISSQSTSEKAYDLHATHYDGEAFDLMHPIFSPQALVPRACSSSLITPASELSWQNYRCPHRSPSVDQARKNGERITAKYCGFSRAESEDGQLTAPRPHTVSTGLRALGLRLPWRRERGALNLVDKLMCLNRTDGVKSSGKEAEGERATNNSVVICRKAGTFPALTKITDTKPWKAGQLPPNMSSGRSSLVNRSQDALSSSFAKQEEIHVEQLTPSEEVGATATVGCRATSDTKQRSAEPAGARPFRCSLIKPKTETARSCDAVRLNRFGGSPLGLTVETVGRRLGSRSTTRSTQTSSSRTHGSAHANLFLFVDRSRIQHMLAFDEVWPVDLPALHPFQLLLMRPCTKDDRRGHMYLMPMHRRGKAVEARETELFWEPPMLRRDKGESASKMDRFCFNDERCYGIQLQKWSREAKNTSNAAVRGRRRPRYKLSTTGVDTWRWMWSSDAQIMVGTLALWRGAMLISRTHTVLSVYGLGMAGRAIVKRGDSRGRGVRFEAYVPESSQIYELQLSVADLKRLSVSEPEKLAVGSKADMVSELIKMLYFDYDLETEEGGGPVSGGGGHLNTYHYRDREPWTCIAGRNDSEYDLHWESNITTEVASGGISHDAKADAPQCPRPGSEGVRVTDDASATVILTVVEGGLGLGKGKEQEHLDRVAGSDGIPDNEQKSVDLDSPIKNTIVSRHRVLSPIGSPGSPTKPVESGRHAEGDGTISATLDKKTISSIGGGNSEEKAKRTRRPRRGVEASVLTRGGNKCSRTKLPDERAVWVRQRLAISRTHNLVNLCAKDRERGATGHGNSEFTIASDGSRPAPCTDDPKSYFSKGGMLQTEALLSKQNSPSAGSWSKQRHLDVSARGRETELEGSGQKKGAGRSGPNGGVPNNLVRVTSFQVLAEENHRAKRQTEVKAEEGVCAGLAIKTRFRDLTLGTAVRLSGVLMRLMVYEFSNQPGSLTIHLTDNRSLATFRMTVGVEKITECHAITRARLAACTKAQRRGFIKRAICGGARLVPMGEGRCREGVPLKQASIFAENSYEKYQTIGTTKSLLLDGNARNVILTGNGSYDGDEKKRDYQWKNDRGVWWRAGERVDAENGGTHRRLRYCAIRCLGRNSSTPHETEVLTAARAMPPRVRRYQLQQSCVADHRSFSRLRYQTPSSYWRQSCHLPAAGADRRQRRGFQPTSLAADTRSRTFSAEDAPESGEVVTTSGLDTIVNCVAPDMGQRTRGVANDVGGISIAEEPT